MRRPGLAFCLAAAACSGGGDDGPPADAPVNFDRRALVRHVAADLLEPAYATFAERAAQLHADIQLHCTTLASGGDSEVTGANARITWGGAMDTWELLDAVQVGPVAATDGQLRSRIYAWPLLAPCTIDQDILKLRNSPASYDVNAVLDNARSMAGLEYLLHHDGTASNCALPPPGWETLAASPTDLARARCELAAVIAGDVRAHAEQLATTWSPSGGDYVGQLAALPERDALNMISDGLFYVDRMVKDMKLGESAGIVINSCGTVEEPCLREMEHRFADRGTQALRVNLRALRDVFTGAYGAEGGLGFDDYLIAVGATDIAARMTANLDATVAAADAVSDSFTAALTTDRASVVAVHISAKTVTDDMKSQFLTVLGLDIPDDVAGDND